MPTSRGFSYLNDTISSVRVEREPDPGTEAKPSGPEGQQQVVFVQPP
jgi:hypothetical protein